MREAPTEQDYERHAANIRKLAQPTDPPTERMADALERAVAVLESIEVDTTRIAAVLEKQAETDILAQFGALLQGDDGVIANRPEPPRASNGATVLYQHPAGERWELIAYRDKDYPSGWRIEERKGQE